VLNPRAYDPLNIAVSEVGIAEERPLNGLAKEFDLARVVEKELLTELMLTVVLDMLKSV
jgi:hypothetical protein